MFSFVCNTLLKLAKKKKETGQLYSDYIKQNLKVLFNSEIHEMNKRMC